MTKLRPYQNNALDRLREAMRAGSKAPILHAPTGAGKTVIAAELIRLANEKGSRCLFVCDAVELIEQTSRKLTDAGVAQHGVIQGGHWRSRPQHNVQIATVQTMHQRRDTLRHDYDLVIFDECHTAISQSFLALRARIIDANPKAYFVGLTATPYRTDGVGLGELFDSIIKVSGVKQLIDCGALVPCRLVFRDDISFSSLPVDTRTGDFRPRELAEFMRSLKVADGIVSRYETHAKGRPFLLFAWSVESSKEIAEDFRNHGYAVEHIDGKTCAAERARIVRELCEGTLDGVCNFGCLTKGFDAPRVSCVIALRPTLSRCLWRQMLGRGSRPSPGKSDFLLIDNAAWSVLHGVFTDEDDVSLTGMRTQEEKKEREPRCGFCSGRLKYPLPDSCPHCGHRIDKRRPKEAGDEIVEIPTMMEMTEDEFRAARDEFDAQTFSRMVRRFASNGTSSDFTRQAAIFKGRFGRWPPSSVGRWRRDKDTGKNCFMVEPSTMSISGGGRG